MKIALYTSHHRLPFWDSHTPCIPYAMYNPDMIKEYVVHDAEDKACPAEECWIMPILNGLFSIEIPDILAHVSYIFNSENKTLENPRRVWVQITTEASEYDANGVPIVEKDGSIQVQHLWGGDNGTYTPYQLLEKELQDSNQSPEFWNEFFTQKLRAARDDAKQEVIKAEKAYERYARIP